MTKEREIAEPRALNDVSDFHTLFDLPILDSPQIPSKKRCELRVSLLEEELEELKEAIEDGDLVEVADAFCDIQYVLAGAILEFGLGEKFKELFEEVQRSNMSKACATLDVAKATQQHYLEYKGETSRIVQKGDQYLVYREKDDKVLKSVNYSPADVKGLLGKRSS